MIVLDSAGEYLFVAATLAGAMAAMGHRGRLVGDAAGRVGWFPVGLLPLDAAWFPGHEYEEFAVVMEDDEVLAYVLASPRDHVMRTSDD